MDKNTSRIVFIFYPIKLWDMHNIKVDEIFVGHAIIGQDIRQTRYY